MQNDPIVNEVRTARQKLLADHGGTLETLVEFLRQREQEHPERVLSPDELRTRREAAEAQAFPRGKR